MINPSNTEIHRDSWEEIWKRKNLMSMTIDTGREAYNSFFRRLIRRYITPGASLLELGCGTSTLTISLAPELGKLVGLDISPEALVLSRQKAAEKGVRNAEFVIGDCLNLSSEYENRFDIVWSQGLMEHFDDPVTVARQHYRALKPGGTALISIPYRISFYTVWYKITRPQMLRSFWPWTEQVFFTKKQLRAIGAQVAPAGSYRTYLLKPPFLGIAILELTKPR
jgi:ubiquinone/menaquinone biosynthesis C-methylase UbiE